MKSDERLWELIAKKDSGEITSEQLKELEYLLQQDRATQTAHNFIEEIWKKRMVADDKTDTAVRWEAIRKRIHAQDEEPGKRRRFFFRRPAIAATIALLVTGGMACFLIFGHKSPLPDVLRKKNQVSTLSGSRTKIVLPDGSKVWLNAGSKLSYEDFAKNPVREVTLSGEAFFEVIHDDHQPFIVHTKTIDVRDIGTSFVIKAYPNDNTFEATLIEGAIQVVDQRATDRKILLKPKEKIIIPLSDSLAEHPIVSGPDKEPSMLYKINKVEEDKHGLLPETAWVENKLVFNGEALGLLAKRMERWYNVKIYFRDTLIAQTPFTGIIENETLEQALKAMQFSKPFGYRMEGNKVWIDKN